MNDLAKTANLVEAAFELQNIKTLKTPVVVPTSQRDE